MSQIRENLLNLLICQRSWWNNELLQVPATS